MKADLRQSDLSVSGVPDGVSAQTFIFDHIPKTAGSAMRGVFEQIFGFDNVSPAITGRSENWAKKNFSSYKMIMGHFHSPVPVGNVQDGRARITVLRDPIDRAISEYYYYRNDVERVPWNKLAIFAKDHDLYAYVRLLESRRDIVVSNFYARHFARQISRQLHSDRKILSLATKAVELYDFIGIQEQFTDSVDLFCCRFGLPPITEIPRYNVTSSRVTVGDLDRATRNKLVELNQLDIALYSLVLSRFQEQKRKIFHRFAGVGKPENSRAIVEERGAARDAAAVPSLNAPESFGNMLVEISHATVIGKISKTNLMNPGEYASIVLSLAAHVDVPDLTVGIEISDELGEIAFGTNTFLMKKTQAVKAGHNYEVRFSFAANLSHGHYLVGASLHTGATHEDCCFHWCDRLTAFDVADDAAFGVGYCRLDPQVEWREENSSAAIRSETCDDLDRQQRTG